MLKELVKDFYAYCDRIYAYERINSLLFWDGMQKNRSLDGIPYRAKTAGIMTEETTRLKTSHEFSTLLTSLEKYEDELDLKTKALLRVCKTMYKYDSVVPLEFFSKYESTRSEGMIVWEHAKKENDVKKMIPYFDKLIKLNKEMCEYYGYESKPYDALLEFYEPEIKSDFLDVLFDDLKKEIVPLILKIKEKNIEKPAFLSALVPVSVQEQIASYMFDKIGVDSNKATLSQTEHPFSFSINVNDHRFSTKYVEDNFTASMYSILHEGGHTVYSTQVSEDVKGTLLDGGCSAAMQEGQARMYENIFGRSKEFLDNVYDDLMALIRPYVGDITKEELYFGLNYSYPGFIRVEADELTYSLHIILRYEMEKDFINGTVDAADLPTIWNAKMKELLGVDVTSDTVGILQDIQWPYGRYGAFVSYILGNMYGAQIVHTMKKDLDVKECLKNGDFKTINGWLKENVHQYSQLYLPSELIEKVSGEKLNAKYFVDYLKDKFNDLYDL